MRGNDARGAMKTGAYVMDPSSFHAPKEERLFGRRKSSVGAHPFVEETGQRRQRRERKRLRRT